MNSETHPQCEGPRLERVKLGLEEVAKNGYAVVDEVLSLEFLAVTRQAMYEVQQRIYKEVGKARLEAAGELGILRLMMKYDDHFFRFLELDEVLATVDATVSSTAIMHLQNGFILPPYPKSSNPSVFQNNFHQDFPRYLHGYLASINIFFAIDEFREDNGATLVVPGSHQKAEQPDPDHMRQVAVPVLCPAGSMMIFDSTLWHAAGHNRSNSDRLAINHQFTRSFLKQQLDYPRALGMEKIDKLPSRTQQLLGAYTRPPASLQEYYVPAEQRLYRARQG